MKKATVSIAYDSEKLNAIKLYMGEKNLKVEDELVRALDGIFSKYVPANVRDFLALRDQLAKPVKKKNPPEATASGGDGFDRSDLR